MDFVEEGKLDEEIKRRQAEWERVRKQDDPVEAPPEVFDNRTLYEKLKEQHEIKKKEFEEQHSLKNQVRGIDTEEADFLSEVDALQMKKEKEIRMEEKQQVEEIKKALASRKSSDELPQIKISVPLNKKENKQASLLSKIIVTSKHKLLSNQKKSDECTSSTSTSSTKTAAADEKQKEKEEGDGDGEEEDEEENNEKKKRKLSATAAEEETAAKPSGAKVIIGILPGLGDYDSSSDSSSSSSSSSDDD